MTTYVVAAGLLLAVGLLLFVRLNGTKIGQWRRARRNWPELRERFRLVRHLNEVLLSEFAVESQLNRKKAAKGLIPYSAALADQWDRIFRRFDVTTEERSLFVQGVMARLQPGFASGLLPSEKRRNRALVSRVLGR